MAQFDINAVQIVFGREFEMAKCRAGGCALERLRYSGGRHPLVYGGRVRVFAGSLLDAALARSVVRYNKAVLQSSSVGD